MKLFFFNPERMDKVYDAGRGPCFFFVNLIVHTRMSFAMPPCSYLFLPSLSLFLALPLIGSYYLITVSLFFFCLCLSLSSAFAFISCK